MNPELKAAQVWAEVVHNMKGYPSERVHLYIAQALHEARAEGLDKGAEIARYWMTSPQKSAAYQAGCRDVETSCFAAAARIRRGEYENPTSEVMGSGTEEKDAAKS
jgi:hypothetical protein